MTLPIQKLTWLNDIIELWLTEFNFKSPVIQCHLQTQISMRGQRYSQGRYKCNVLRHSACSKNADHWKACELIRITKLFIVLQEVKWERTHRIGVYLILRSLNRKCGKNNDVVSDGVVVHRRRDIGCYSTYNKRWIQ